MTDILSQSEINDLLGSLGASDTAGGETGAPVAQTYDFKKANRFSKEQLRTLQTVFSTFARLLSSQLTSTLRTRCDCELVGIEEQSFKNYSLDLPLPVVIGVVAGEPLYGSYLMSLSPEVAYMIISRLLGGMTGGVGQRKQFTEIELTLISRVMRQIMPVFGEAWSKLCDIEPRLERVETNPQFTQVVASNEPVAVAKIRMTVGEEEGLITICLPHLAIKPIANLLNTWFLYTGPDNEERQINEKITGKVVDTTVTLTAYFEETTATVSDILSLQVGDVIQLDQRLDDPVKVKVEHIPKFYAKLGTLRNKCAVQIVDTVDPADEMAESETVDTNEGEAKDE